MSDSIPANENTSTPRTWRVTAHIYAPMSTPNTPPQLGMQLTFASRLLSKTVAYSDIEVALRPSETPPTEPTLPPGWERAFLLADIQTPDALNAVEYSVEVFEKIIDSLSFELGTAIRFGQFEVLDVTPPLCIAEERDFQIFSGPPYGTNIRSVDMECIKGAVLVSLPDGLPNHDPKIAAALRWFNKAMSTDLLHDTFIFLWIALEILCDLSPVSVEAPYQARCNHTIKHCPECGESTAREVRGRTIRRYLETAFGISPETSGALWRMRQMMHGAINFEPSKLRDLPSLVQPLRSAVAAGIKRALGIDTYAAPIVMAAGLSINPSMGVGGTRPIVDGDLHALTDEPGEDIEATPSGALDPEA